jgi:hypothetical protein
VSTARRPAPKLPLSKQERLRQMRFSLLELPYTVRAIDDILARANAILQAERRPKTLQ